MINPFLENNIKRNKRFTFYLKIESYLYYTSYAHYISYFSLSCQLSSHIYVDDPHLATGADGHDQDASDQPDADNQPATAPLLVPDVYYQPNEDGRFKHSTKATTDLPDVGVQLHQQPPDPPDLEHGQLRRSRRMVKRRFSCLDIRGG